MYVLQDCLVLMICHVSKMKGILSSVNSVMQGCTNPVHQVTWATKLCMVALYICWFAVWNLLHVNFVALDICDPPQNCIRVPAF
jgi:hypothetical protein